MNTISMARLAEVVQRKRRELELTQQQVHDMTGINRQLIGRIEKGEFLPSLPQLNSLSKSLCFSIADLLETDNEQEMIYAMRGDAKSDEEAEGIEKLLTMMNFLKSQSLLRRKLVTHDSKNS